VSRARRPALVRYVSPFGSPAWMTRDRAEQLLAEDDRRYEWLAAVSSEVGEDLLGARARREGPPRIEVLR
jgi:hypothetical protein